MKVAWNRKDLTGRHGNVVVLGVDRREGKVLYWKCRCDCGNEYSTRSHTFRRKDKFHGCRKCGGKSIGEHRWKGYEEMSGHYIQKIKAGAKSRNLPFKVTLKYLWELYLKQDRKCALSGSLIYFTRRIDLELQTASLDRIDNSKGYVKGNVQWVHKQVNEMKMNQEQCNFITWCHLISDKNRKL